MTDVRTATVRSAPSRSLSRPGRWCIAAGLVGVAQGAALLTWPHQVAEARYSFPFTAVWFVVAQATFFAQHLPLMAAVSAVAGDPGVHGHKLARRSLFVAAAGLGLLALMELVAMAAATTAEDSTLGTVINTLYSVPVLLAGAGLLVGAITLLRRSSRSRGLPWTLLAIGIFVFAGLVPALATNSFLAGRLAIMGWMALFAVLGTVMQRPAP